MKTEKKQENRLVVVKILFPLFTLQCTCNASTYLPLLYHSLNTSKEYNRSEYIVNVSAVAATTVTLLPASDSILLVMLSRSKS